MLSRRRAVFASRPTTGARELFCTDAWTRYRLNFFSPGFFSHTIAFGYFDCGTCAADGCRYPAVGPAVLPYCCCCPHSLPSEPATGLCARVISQLSKRRLHVVCLLVFVYQHIFLRVDLIFVRLSLFLLFIRYLRFKICDCGGCRLHASRPCDGFSGGPRGRPFTPAGRLRLTARAQTLPVRGRPDAVAAAAAAARSVWRSQRRRGARVCRRLQLTDRDNILSRTKREH